MKLADFDFDLPVERIAQAPARPREAARLLHVPPMGDFGDHAVADLPRLLRPGDLLVVNDSRVIPAQLDGLKSGAKIGVTLHMEIAPDRWRAFAKPARKLAAGDIIAFGAGFSAEVAARAGGEVELVFDRGGADLAAALERWGAPPLPPYIRRPEGARDSDAHDYQTMFADRPGSVAAPTAGLHFTPALEAACLAAGARLARVTLHVGAGTFLPVKVEAVADHVMHAERWWLPEETAAAIAETRAAGGRVIAVGTTALRTLEASGGAAGAGETDLFITPGYRFAVVDRLMTNFHLPKSTLFMLVCAFAGVDRMKAAYAHAIAAEYRFFSYGDATLLERA